MLKGRVWGGWLGVLVSFSQLAFIVAILGGLPVYFGGFYSDLGRRIVVFTLLLIVTSVEVLAFGIALQAMRRRKMHVLAGTT